VKIVHLVGFVTKKPDTHNHNFSSCFMFQVDLSIQAPNAG